MSNDGRQCISMLMSEPFAAPQVSFRGRFMVRKALTTSSSRHDLHRPCQLLVIDITGEANSPVPV